MKMNCSFYLDTKLKSRTEKEKAFCLYQNMYMCSVTQNLDGKRKRCLMFKCLTAAQTFDFEVKIDSNSYAFEGKRQADALN